MKLTIINVLYIDMHGIVISKAIKKSEPDLFYQKVKVFILQIKEVSSNLTVKTKLFNKF